MSSLGRYEILDKLGTGSMGTVYLARDTVLDREVALKTIRTGVEADPELRERFYREARACARLQHPSIVIVHDLGEIDRTAYIAMELLRGLDFRKIVEARTEIPLTVKIEAMAQVCEALAHAHRHGIIHRDIKPSNLFLVGGKLAKVLDFGIARLPSSRLTIAGKILGTPNYMAPEQIMVQPADARADLFSAAVVFFEFLVFAHPFRSDVISRRIVQSAPDSVFDYDPQLPAQLERIFERALAKDPDLRYQSGDDFAADLRVIVDALLQNAFTPPSLVQLPSDREIRDVDVTRTPPDADPSLLRPAPPGEDIHEWRLSELMRLIPAFEAAVLKHDASSARQAFRELAAIGSVDSRFQDAVQLCRVRLGELEIEPGVTGLNPTQTGTADSFGGKADVPVEVGRIAGGDHGTAPKTCGYCGTTNRRAAAYCIKCGGKLQAAPAEPPVAALEVQEITAPAAAAQVVPRELDREPPRGAGERPEPSSAVRVPPAPESAVSRIRGTAHRIYGQSLGRLQAGWKRLLMRPPRRLWPVLAVTGLAIALILAVILVLALRPVKIESAVATADVAPARAVLYKQAAIGSIITTLSRGNRVNVLRIPGVRNQEWIPVQFAGRAPLRPGYMRLADLRGWDSTDPRTKLTLIRLFRDPGFPNDEQVRAETQALQQLLNGVPGSKVAYEARLDLAELDLSVARRLKSDGDPTGAWRDRIESARRNLDAARGEPSLSDEVDRAEQQIESVLAGAPPGESIATTPVNSTGAGTGLANTTATASKKASKKRIDELLTKAEDSFRQRDVDEAEHLLDEVQKLDHDNSNAQDLRNRIVKRKQLLDKYGKGKESAN